MAGLPTVQVLLDDVNNGGTWPFDITSRVRLTEGYNLTTRGRGDEDSAPSPVTLTLVLDNTDGGVTLDSTSGGYGAINVDRGIRLKLTANGVPTTRFTGFVQQWPVEWPTGSDRFALCRITATDAMARWARRPLKSLPEEETFVDTPTAYYTLGEPAGSISAADSSGSQMPSLAQRSAMLGVPSNPVTFGAATGPATDGLTGATFPVATLGLRASVMPAMEWMSCWFLSTNAGTAAVLAMSIDADNDVALQLGFDASGNLEAFYSNLAGTINLHAIYTSVDVTTGAGWIAGVALEPGTPGTLRLYLNGAEVATDTGTAPAPSWANGGLEVGNNLIGSMAHVAVGVNSGLAGPVADRMLGRTVSMLGGYDGESAGDRIIKLASYEGTAPAGTIDAGATPMPFVEFTGRKVADAIQQVADAEQGTAYVDGEGQTTFHGRHRAALAVVPDLVVSVDSDILDPSTTVQADAQQVVNFATGSRADADGAATLTVRDAVRERVQGQYPGGGEYLVKTDAEVLDRLNWLVNTRVKPAARLPDLSFDLLTADAATQAAVMALDVDSRVQITPLPSQSPTGSAADLSVIGYAESLSKDSWTWTANAISWPTYEQAWVLGDATYGQLGLTTRLAV